MTFNTQLSAGLVGLGCIFGFGLGLSTKPVLEASSVGLAATIQTVQTFALTASFGALGMLGEFAFDYLKSITSLSTMVAISKGVALGSISLVCISYLPERIKKDPVAKVIVPTLITTACAYSAL
jgi:hypothetical protein